MKLFLNILILVLLFYFNSVSSAAETKNSSNDTKIIEVTPQIRQDTRVYRQRVRHETTIIEVRPMLRTSTQETTVVLNDTKSRELVVENRENLSSTPNPQPLTTKSQLQTSDSQLQTQNSQLPTHTEPFPPNYITANKSTSYGVENRENLSSTPNPQPHSEISSVTMIDVPQHKEPSKLFIRFSPDTTIVEADKPFPIKFIIVDENGAPVVSHSEPVIFESLFGVIPILSNSKWINGVLEDTILIRRPGKNVLVIATSGKASGSMVFEVKSPLPDSSTWLTLAEVKLREGKFDDAVYYYKLASSLKSGGDAEIERKIAELYLSRGEWKKAEEHFRRAIRAIATEK